METASAAIGIKQPARGILPVFTGSTGQLSDAARNRVRFVVASGGRPATQTPAYRSGLSSSARSELLLVEFAPEKKDLHFVAALPIEQTAQIALLARGLGPVVYCAGQDAERGKPALEAVRLPRLEDALGCFGEAAKQHVIVSNPEPVPNAELPHPETLQAMDVALTGESVVLGLAHTLQLLDANTLQTQCVWSVPHIPRMIYTGRHQLAALHWTCACFVDEQAPGLVFAAHTSGALLLFDRRQQSIAGQFELHAASWTSSRKKAAECGSLAQRAYELLPCDTDNEALRLHALQSTTPHGLSSTVLAAARMPQQSGGIVASTDDGVLLFLDLLRGQVQQLAGSAVGDRAPWSVFASAIALEALDSSIRVAVAAYGANEEPVVSTWRGRLQTAVSAATPSVSSLDRTGAVDGDQVRSDNDAPTIFCEGFTFEESARDHDDLIVALAWHDAARNAMLASLSADGRLVVRTGARQTPVATEAMRSA
jgi:hypothetical protein